MKKRLAIVILAITITALWVTPALAAKGVITDVNPSGIGTPIRTIIPAATALGSRAPATRMAMRQTTLQGIIRPSAMD